MCVCVCVQCVSVGGLALQSRVEIEGLAKIFFNKWGYYLTLLFLIISLQATNISSIIISAQVRLLAPLATLPGLVGRAS